MRHLQFEHVKPFAKGGKNAESNIKYYCRTHNQLTAMEQFEQIFGRTSMNISGKT
jgi:hypothetical protein